MAAGSRKMDSSSIASADGPTRRWRPTEADLLSLSRAHATAPPRPSPQDDPFDPPTALEIFSLDAHLRRCAYETCVDIIDRVTDAAWDKTLRVEGKMAPLAQGASTALPFGNKPDGGRGARLGLVHDVARFFASFGPERGNEAAEWVHETDDEYECKIEREATPKNGASPKGGDDAKETSLGLGGRDQNEETLKTHGNECSEVEGDNAAEAIPREGTSPCAGPDLNCDTRSKRAHEFDADDDKGVDASSRESKKRRHDVDSAQSNNGDVSASVASSFSRWYPPTLLPIASIHAPPSVLDRKENAERLYLGLSSISRPNDGDHDSASHAKRGGEDDGEGEAKDEVCAPLAPAAVLLRPSQSRSGPHPSVGTNSLCHSALLREVLRQCARLELQDLAIDTARRDDLSRLLNGKSKNMAENWFQRLRMWASDCPPHFNSIVIILTSPELLSNETLGAFVNSLVALRSECGVPVCLAVLGVKCARGDILSGLGMMNGGTGGYVEIRDFNCPSSADVLDKILSDLYLHHDPSRRLPVLLPASILSSIMSTYHDSSSSVSSAIGQIKRMIATHFARPGTFVSMLSYPSFLLRHWKLVAWFCVDKSAREMVLGPMDGGKVKCGADCGRRLRVMVGKRAELAILVGWARARLAVVAKSDGVKAADAKVTERKIAGAKAEKVGESVDSGGDPLDDLDTILPASRLIEGCLSSHRPKSNKDGNNAYLSAHRYLRHFLRSAPLTAVFGLLRRWHAIWKVHAQEYENVIDIMERTIDEYTTASVGALRKMEGGAGIAALGRWLHETMLLVISAIAEGGEHENDAKAASIGDGNKEEDNTSEKELRLFISASLDDFFLQVAPDFDSVPFAACLFIHEECGGYGPSLPEPAAGVAAVLRAGSTASGLSSVVASDAALAFSSMTMTSSDGGGGAFKAIRDEEWCRRFAEVGGLDSTVKPTRCRFVLAVRSLEHCGLIVAREGRGGGSFYEKTLATWTGA